ncbi:hypothetical protein CY35_05G123500 [Sphagnum magellanicum]|nr:hypothetical protein CY35_05G123500 [Sphagnum magellanicum]
MGVSIVHRRNPAEAVVVLLKSNDQKFIGFRSQVAEGKILQATKDEGLILRFSNQNFDSWEQWAVYGQSLNNCVLVNRGFPDKGFHAAFHKVLPVLESSLEAMKAQLVKAQAEAAASKSQHEESDKRITELEVQIVNGNSSEAAPLGGGPWEVQVKALEGQIEELEAELKKSKELVALCPVAALVSPPHNSSAESLAANVDEDYNILVGKEQQKKTMTHLWSELNKTEKELEESKATAANLREMLTAAVEKATDLEKKVQQMTSLMEQNTSLASQMAVLQGQLQENQTKLEADVNALKRKSFREVTLEGELQALRAQALELTLLRSQLSVLENKLHEAEARQHQQNMSLVQEQQRLTAAQQEILSLKDNLINHSSHKQISQLQGIITSLEDKLKTTETEKSKLENDYKELLCNTAEVTENGGTSKTGLLVLSSNVNQPKANSTQEGVKSIVADWFFRRGSQRWTNLLTSITCHA